MSHFELLESALKQNYSIKFLKETHSFQMLKSECVVWGDDWLRWGSKTLLLDSVNEDLEVTIRNLGLFHIYKLDKREKCMEAPSLSGDDSGRKQSTMG
ncbi:MAG: hypothetical protein JNL29_11805 [Nitrospira sp.]|nr:hypothetical protein [Nitrospira sp.]